jgi:transcriptional regulator with XRE-family HTH domain
MSFMETIGQRIRRIRKERGIDRQEDLAPLCGIKQSTLSDIESKNREFSATVLYAFAKALEVSTDEIMYGTKEEIVGQSELIRIFSELSQEQRNFVLSMMRGLSDDNKPNIKAA